MAGRVLRAATGEVTVADVVNAFGHAKQNRLAAGKITARTLADYYATGVRIAKAFGRNRPVSDLRPSDFEEYMAQLEKQWGAVAVGNEIQRVRCIFRYGAAAADGCPAVRMGPDFERADKRRWASSALKMAARCSRWTNYRRYRAGQPTAQGDGAPWRQCRLRQCRCRNAAHACCRPR
jgi:hypothetical protein